MSLIGKIQYMDNEFVYLESKFTKGSRQLILASTSNLTEQDTVDLFKRSQNFYLGGGLLDKDYILGILDPVRKLNYGSTTILSIAYESINDVIRGSKLAGTVTHELGVDVHTHKGSTVKMKGSAISYVNIKNDKIVIEAKENNLNHKPRALGKLLTPITGSGGIRYNTANFKDASLETLEREGFDTSWLGDADFVEIHTKEEWTNLVEPAFAKALQKYKVEPDFEDFIMSLDFESDGLNAYCDKHPEVNRAVYLSLCFEDDRAFGIFVDMEHFDNIDTEFLAERLTNLTQIDPLNDREITINAGDGETYTFKRSDYKVTAHNLPIDRRFGFTIGADVWIDFCTLQMAFNLDPFLTKGRNGLKPIVKKFFGIEYAELRDICGQKNVTMFKHLTDRRVIMMYGCADTYWHRKAAQRLIKICEESTEYYNGVNHYHQHLRLDSLYMNSKATTEYDGMRINKDAFKKEFEEKSRILNLYYSFMAQYVGRVKAYKEIETIVLHAERLGVPLKPFSAKDIFNAPPFRVDKWSGKELTDVLFSTLGYPVLVWTEQNKKAKLEGRAFKPKPAINTKALKHYMEYKATHSPQELEDAFTEANSLEKLYLYSTYLSEDFTDPVSGKVLIEKKKFNSLRLPFMHVLHLISPIIKSITAELNPIVKFDCEYKFANCNMHSAVTRRDLNPIQTVSKNAKYNYIAYTDDYYYGAVDQSAVEIRILYGLSKDKGLIEPLNNPEKDTHTETAAMMHQKPAYTITKDVRKGIKFLAFGRPYGKEVYSACIDFFGNDHPDNMAQMAYLFELYDNKLASVMKVLNDVRDAMDIPVDPPESLKEFLGMDPEKKYGRMINEFGFCQHLEIRENDNRYRQALRRKAGNFIIQGFAANLLRIIYLRMFLALWEKGWIQDKRFLVHLTVHDEVDFSYHKSLNPVEVMKILHQSLTVKMPGFPTFFVGINFGKSWGDAKKDESELPVLLVDQLVKRYDAGEFDKGIPEDKHIEFFNEERERFYERRVASELKKVNKGSNIWTLEKLTDEFQNYTVRSMLPTVTPKPSLKLPKGCEDPVLLLAAYLPKFINDFLSKDGRTHYLTYKSMHVEINEELIKHEYATIADMMNHKPLLTVEGEDSPEFSVDEMLQVDLEFDDFEAEFDEDDMGFDFDVTDSDEDDNMDGIQNLDTGFYNRYTSYKDDDKKKVYASLDERIVEESKVISIHAQATFNEFKVKNNRIIYRVESIDTFNQIVHMCRNNVEKSDSSLQLFVNLRGSLKDLGHYNKDFLTTVDEFLTEKKQKGAVL